MDAGFGSGANIAWLIEMGYAVETKSPNAKTTRALQKRVKPKTPWTRVGANAEMIAWQNYSVNACPYPLTVGLERFGLGHSVEYATLICYQDDPTLPDLPSWFHEYNGRQTIEAGNKEMKSTFKVQHLMSHSLAGIQLQVIFAGLVTNLVRWSSACLREQVATPTPKVTSMLCSVKTMVRIGATSPARVQRLSHGTNLHFAPSSALPGTVLYLSGQHAYQLALPFNRSLEFSSERAIRLLVAQKLRYGKLHGAALDHGLQGCSEFGASIVQVVAIANPETRSAPPQRNSAGVANHSRNDWASPIHMRPALTGRPMIWEVKMVES